MAYNAFYPATYQPIYPNYQNLVQQPLQAQNQQQSASQQQPQIQNGGFVIVRSEEEARNYPVAPGNSVTFKNETEQYMYTKTMGFSQLDRPLFEKYRLIKEDGASSQLQNAANEAYKKAEVDLTEYVTKAEIKPIFARLEALEADRMQKKEKIKKKEGADDE